MAAYDVGAWTRFGKERVVVIGGGGICGDGIGTDLGAGGGGDAVEGVVEGIVCEGADVGRAGGGVVVVDVVGAEGG